MDAGWYPDHTDSALLRYWDGTAWTEHTSAAAPPPPVVLTPPPGFGPPQSFGPPTQSFSPPRSFSPPQSFTPPPAASYTVAKKSSKRPLAIALVVVLLVAAGAGTWFLTRDDGFTVDDAKAVFSRHGSTCTRGKASTVGELTTRFSASSSLAFANELRDKMKREVASLDPDTVLTAWTCEGSGGLTSTAQTSGSLVTWDDGGTERPLFAMMLPGNTLTKELRAVGTNVLVLDLGLSADAGDQPGVNECKTERATIVTAFAAANASSMNGQPAEFRDFLAPGVALMYFEEPTSAGAARQPGNTVSQADCADITAAELN